MIRRVVIGNHNLSYDEFKALATLARLEGFETVQEFLKFLKLHYSK